MFYPEFLSRSSKAGKKLRLKFYFLYLGELFRFYKNFHNLYPVKYRFAVISPKAKLFNGVNFSIN